MSTIGAATDTHDRLSGAQRKAAIHLLPLVALGYLLAYIDRVNVGLAKLQMQPQVGLTEATFGLGAGLFFVSYILLEVPSNGVVTKVGARRWMARIMITWGILTALMFVVSVPWQFYLLRFLIGAAEAGFFPGVLYYLTLWFPTRQRGRILSYFIAGLPIASMIGNPVGGVIMLHLNGVGGLSGWQWLFIVEGTLPVLLGIWYLFSLPDRPQDARWLDQAEREEIEKALSTDAAAAPHTPSAFLTALANKRVWVLGFMCFASLAATYCISFWLPTLIKDSGVSNPQTVGLLSSIPAAAGLLAMIINGRHSDLARERRWHIAIPLLISAAGLVATTLVTGNTAGIVIAFAVANAGLVAHYPVYWCLPATFLTGAAAAAGFALASSIGNVGGLFATYAVGWLRDLTGTASIVIIIFAGVLVASAVVSILLPKEVNR